MLESIYESLRSNLLESVIDKVRADIEADKFVEGTTADIAKRYGQSTAVMLKLLKTLKKENLLTMMTPDRQGPGHRKSPEHYFWALKWD